MWPFSDVLHGVLLVTSVLCDARDGAHRWMSVGITGRSARGPRMFLPAELAALDAGARHIFGRFGHVFIMKRLVTLGYRIGIDAILFEDFPIFEIVDC
jgi:hypothetical protein